MKIAIWIMFFCSLPLTTFAAPVVNYELVAEQLLNKSEAPVSAPPFSSFKDHFEHISNFSLSTGYKIADQAVMMMVDGLDLVVVIEPQKNSFNIHVLANSAVGVPGWRIDSRGLFMKFAIIESQMWSKYGEEAAFFNMFKAWLHASDDFRRNLPRGPLFRQLKTDQFVLYEGFTHHLHSRKNHPLRKEVLADFLKMLADPLNCETIMTADGLSERVQEKLRLQTTSP